MSGLLIALAVILGIWALDIWWRPYIDCTHCEGNKRDYDSAHEHFRLTTCVWCLTTGMRLRWELRLLSVVV